MRNEGILKIAIFHIGYKITSTKFCFVSYGITYYEKWTTECKWICCLIWPLSVLSQHSLKLQYRQFYHNTVWNCNTVMFDCISHNDVAAYFHSVLISLDMIRAVRSGDQILMGWDLSHQPDQPWGPPSLLYNEYWNTGYLSGGKAARVQHWISTPSSTEVKEKVEP